MCAYQGMPLLPPVPGANVFLAKRDLTTQPDAEGNQLIVCRNVEDSAALKAAYYAYKWLAKVAG